MYSREIESSVQMRLFSMSKRHFVIVICLFIATFILSILIGISGPSIINSNSNIVNNSKIHKMTIQQSLKSSRLTVFNQQLWLTAKAFTKISKETFGELNFQIDIYGYLNKIDKVLFYNGTNKVSKRKFKCFNHVCDEIFLAHINFIKYQNYEINVKIIDHQPKFSKIEFIFSTFNVMFSQLEIWFRFGFLVFGFITTVLYNSSLRKFSIRDWSMEQKWIAVLLPSLLLYNNPLIPLKFIVNSAVTSVIDTIFQATFVSLLLLFWVTVYHGMREIKRRCLSFHCPKIMIVVLIWLLFIILPTYQSIKESEDPTFYYKLQSSFLIYKLFLMGALILYILYTLFLIITACSELRSIPYFGIRIKFFTCLMFFVLVFNLVMIYLRFGSGLFNDNFIFERASRYSNSVEFCSQYGIINIYLLTMAYVYSPSKNAIHEANFQDDPNISMVNESDEDVLYGSDIEQTVLLSKQSSKTK